MYQWSGGTDYRNVCKWCKNCIEKSRNRQKIYKCKIYGITDNYDTDWNPGYIACKSFNADYSGHPVIQGGQRTVIRDTSDEIEGQMRLSDYPGIVP